MMFSVDSNWSSVGFDAIQELADKTHLTHLSELIIIEKMALVHVLAPYASKYGVALVNTTGYFTGTAKS